MANKLVTPVRLEPDLIAQLRNRAAQLGVTPSRLTRAALRTHLALLEAEDVEALNDPEMREVRARQRAKELLDEAA